MQNSKTPHMYYNFKTSNMDKLGTLLLTTENKPKQVILLLKEHERKNSMLCLVALKLGSELELGAKLANLAVWIALRIGAWKLGSILSPTRMCNDWPQSFRDRHPGNARNLHTARVPLPALDRNRARSLGPPPRAAAAGAGTASLP
jgi:hypothetical protein